jgi:hypothetical protein
MAKVDSLVVCRGLLFLVLILFRRFLLGRVLKRLLVALLGMLDLLGGGVFVWGMKPR